MFIAGVAFLSSVLSDFRTAPTRSLAIRDHDSSRLCASQQAAGPKPLILYFSIFIIEIYFNSVTNI